MLENVHNWKISELKTRKGGLDISKNDKKKRRLLHHALKYSIEFKVEKKEEGN